MTWVIITATGRHVIRCRKVEHFVNVQIRVRQVAVSCEKLSGLFYSFSCHSKLGPYRWQQMSLHKTNLSQEHDIPFAMEMYDFLSVCHCVNGRLCVDRRTLWDGHPPSAVTYWRVLCCERHIRVRKVTINIGMPDSAEQSAERVWWADMQYIKYASLQIACGHVKRKFTYYGNNRHVWKYYCMTKYSSARYM